MTSPWASWRTDELTISSPALPSHVAALLPHRNPARYASAVKHITVVPPACPHFAPNLATTPVSHGEDDVFLALLEVCAGTVDRVEWRGVGVWGEAVSQVSPQSRARLYTARQ